MKVSWLLSRSALVLLAVSLFAMPYAQSQDGGTNNPPVRGVRLSDVEGSVQLAQGNTVLTDAATANITLYEGSRLTTIGDGRAEVQLDDGGLIRLTPASTLTINVLRQQGTQTETEIELNNGLAYFELKGKHDNGGVRIKFGDVLLVPTVDSTIRINFDKAPGSVAALIGEVHIDRPNGFSVDLHGGENLDLDARDATHYNLTEQIQPDSWDGWNHDRDLALAGAASQQTPASESMANGSAPAWNDLDANGNWYNVPDVGTVWSPYDAAYSGWDPYGSGNWLWTPNYGYTWISGYPWGYLPYRCGMWNYYDSFGWGWAPGFGGCNPWFVGGFWYGNYGYFPYGWHHPHPPHVPSGGHRPVPLVAVNRNTAGGKLIRPTNGPVTIAGHTVTPLHPVVARGTYASVGNSGQVNRGTYSGNGGGSGTGNVNHPVSTNGSQPHPTGGSGSSRSAPPAPSHSGSTSSSSHSSGGGSSSGHSSGGGGGGGGGGHSGGGGGGGGGGGHH